MYKDILDIFSATPELYEQGEDKFWDDEHISKSMLQAHLEPELEAASRKHHYIKKSAKWIGSLCDWNSENNLLDLGCGPGIYAEVFDDLGFNVTGIDFSKRSIEYAINTAEANNKNIEYFYQDYRTISFEAQFDIATLIYCDYGVLSPKDRKIILSNVYRALKPGGLIILDGWTLNQYADFSEDQSVTYENGGFWSENPYVCVKRNIKYPETNAFLDQYVIITENNSKCYNIWNTAFDEESLSLELKEAGFDSFDIYSEVSGETFSSDSNTICIVARK